MTIHLYLWYLAHISSSVQNFACIIWTIMFWNFYNAFDVGWHSLKKVRRYCLEKNIYCVERGSYFLKKFSIQIFGFPTFQHVKPEFSLLWCIYKFSHEFPKQGTYNIKNISYNESISVYVHSMLPDPYYIYLNSFT